LKKRKKVEGKELGGVRVGVGGWRAGKESDSESLGMNGMGIYWMGFDKPLKWEMFLSNEWTDHSDIVVK
jgi:hypothetical protein